ncbi:hypothetical protein PSTG_12937 [Puccinia striiformis f. sp. tritici PST-78]|uniref:Uncharacterized protein n=1 Tax=Puccinia striiformis f. sp. tritici PST-78 TaxID=1165861 RepID=A0A0L0V2Z3_9BASI|nr:hypothetical protein PSTG_12937 [Puccinia striiformis f. sp. tritici PST-78]
MACKNSGEADPGVLLCDEEEAEDALKAPVGIEIQMTLHVPVGIDLSVVRRLEFQAGWQRTGCTPPWSAVAFHLLEPLPIYQRLLGSLAIVISAPRPVIEKLRPWCSSDRAVVHSSTLTLESDRCDTGSPFSAKLRVPAFRRWYIASLLRGNGNTPLREVLLGPWGV